MTNTWLRPSLRSTGTDTGGRWEGLFLTVEPSGAWQILCKARGRLSAGETIQLLDRTAHDDVQLRLVAKSDDGVWLVRPLADESSWELLERIGRVPLPKYIRKGEMLEEDRQRYQTVFAKYSGSAAAPDALEVVEERTEPSKLAVGRVQLFGEAGELASVGALAAVARNLTEAPLDSPPLGFERVLGGVAVRERQLDGVETRCPRTVLGHPEELRDLVPQQHGATIIRRRDGNRNGPPGPSSKLGRPIDLDVFRPA